MRLRTSDSRRTGFTLAELLVAATLMSIVMAAVYAAFSSSIRLWRLGEANVETYQNARTTLSIMSRELQNVLTGTEYLFEGGEDSLTFLAAVVPMNVEEGEAVRPAQITYRLKQDPARKGSTLVREEALVEGRLPVKTQPNQELDAASLKLGREHQFEMAGGVLDFHVTYFRLQSAEDAGDAATAPLQSFTLVEQEDNPQGLGLPRGVRLQITLVDENSDTGQTTFTTTIAFSAPTVPLSPESLSSVQAGAA